MSSHFCRFFSILLLAIDLHVGVGKISKILVLTPGIKTRLLNAWRAQQLSNENLARCLWYYIVCEGHRLRTSASSKWFTASWCMLHLLVLLLQEKKLVLLKKQNSKECDVCSKRFEECDPYNLFLKMHLLPKLYLETVYEESQLSLLLQGKSFSRIWPISAETADTLQSETLPLNKTRLSPSPDDIKQTAACTTGDLSNYSKYQEIELSIAQQFKKKTRAYA